FCFCRRDVSSTVLREYFATALLRLNLLECNYPPLEFETTWELCVRLASMKLDLHNTQHMSWLMRDSHYDQDTRNRVLFPIKSFSGGNVQLQLLFEQIEEETGLNAFPTR
ncbi:hypothetical protein PHET_08106, partial [Paragonimus heterotremus]